jgi:hypothetical protein
MYYQLVSYVVETAYSVIYSVLPYYYATTYYGVLYTTTTTENPFSHRNEKAKGS